MDPYHIFKVNDKKWNGNPTFVMKSSRLGHRNSSSDGYTQQKNTHDRMCSLHECITFESERLHHTNIMG